MSSVARTKLRRNATAARLFDVPLDSQMGREVQELRRHPLSEAVLIENISLAEATGTSIRHRLGREWVGYLVCKLIGATSTGRIVAAKARDDGRFIHLTATGHGATITVSLLVF